MMVGWMPWSMAGAQDQQGWRKGPWTPEEDKLLTDYVTQHGEGRWSSVSRCAGLRRSGKSCRLRWVNYLRPGLKRGQITPQEEGIIIELHALFGNKWSTIARYLPGRTDNEIKNYWRTHFKKRDRLPSQKTKVRKLQDQKKIHQPQLQELHKKDVVLGEATKSKEDNKTIIDDYDVIEDCHLSQLVNYPNNQETTNHEDSLWSGSLWSFTEPQGVCNTTPKQHMQEQLCSKVANMQNQPTFNDFNGFSWGSGDYANYNTLFYT